MSGIRVMRSKALIRLLLVAVVAAVAGRAEATPPGLIAKREQARRVLQEIAAIDEQLSVVTERFDGARVTLDALRGRLAAERVSLARARMDNRRAETQVARLLVTLYTSGLPSALDAILGATSISGMLETADAENALSREDAQVAAIAKQARQRLGRRVRSLEADRAAAAKSVRELEQARAQVEHGLAQRRTLLASVQTQIAQIEARARARQQRLAAEARARLAAEQAARALLEVKQRQAAATRARSEQAAALKAARAAATSTTTTTAPTTAADADPSTTATTSSISATPAPAAPADSIGAGSPSTIDPATTGPLPAGHPQAAQVALNYIGVPYLWAGASPAGFDCSGLVSYVFAQLGITLPHYAVAQYGYGVPVARGQLQPGDLVFFDNLDHVGIYIGADQFVDAPHTGTFVQINSLDDAWYSSRYVGARRI
jgi:cell wall-associated NlpC family hydrolase